MKFAVGLPAIRQCATYARFGHLPKRGAAAATVHRLAPRPWGWQPSPMPHLASWLLPTLLGPVFGSWLYVALAAQLSSLPLPRAVWLAAAVVASGISFTVGIFTLLLDVLLLRLRVRQPPTGLRAWAMGIAIPFPVFFSWQTLGRWALLGWGYLLLWLVAPMVVTTCLVRLGAASKPNHWQ